MQKIYLEQRIAQRDEKEKVIKKVKYIYTFINL